MTTSLKVIFAGTPAFATPALEALMKTGHTIVAVYTQADRPAGRGLKLTPSPVKILALSHHLPIYQPASLNDSREQKQLAHFQADVMVVAAFGMLLPPAVLHIPRLGCLNIHPSLLPRFRGATPIQSAILAGDTITGVTIMRMDEGLDTGPILLQKTCAIAADETTQSLHDKLAKYGADALIEALNLIMQGHLQAKPQQASQATYGHKIKKEDALLDWTESAIQLERKIRAFNPWPIAYVSWQQQSLRLWEAKAMPSAKVTPGTLIHASREGIDVATGDGFLRLLRVQYPSGKIISAADFYAARRDKFIVGQAFS